MANLWIVTALNIPHPPPTNPLFLSTARAHNKQGDRYQTREQRQESEVEQQESQDEETESMGVRRKSPEKIETIGKGELEASAGERNQTCIRLSSAASSRSFRHRSTTYASPRPSILASSAALDGDEPGGVPPPQAAAGGGGGKVAVRDGDDERVVYLRPTPGISVSCALAPGTLKGSWKVLAEANRTQAQALGIENVLKRYASLVARARERAAERERETSEQARDK